MTVLAFDTLAFSKKLRTQFTAEQAETLAEAFVAGVDEQLATKTDLKDLELRLDTRFAQVDTRFTELEGKMGTRFAQVDGRFSELERKIAESANRMILWTAGAIFSSTALVIAVLKFAG